MTGFCTFDAKATRYNLAGTISNGNVETVTLFEVNFNE
jgi:hypothetical protein